MECLDLLHTWISTVPVHNTCVSQRVHCINVKKNKLQYSFSMGLLLVHRKVDFILLIGNQDLQDLLHLLRIEEKGHHRSGIGSVRLLHSLWNRSLRKLVAIYLSESYLACLFFLKACVFLNFSHMLRLIKECCSFSIFVYLKRQSVRDCFHLLIYSPNDCNS